MGAELQSRSHESISFKERGLKRGEKGQGTKKLGKGGGSKHNEKTPKATTALHKKKYEKERGGLFYWGLVEGTGAQRVAVK